MPRYIDADALKAIVEGFCAEISKRKETDNYERDILYRNRVYGYSKAYGAVLNAIDEAPTIEPEQTHGEWIPCSERLPKAGQVVIVTDDTGSVFEYELNPLNAEKIIDGKWTYCKHEIIAWMPRPEPYRKEGDSKMKLVIEIPEDIYEWYKHNIENPDNSCAVGAVALGVPYEERRRGEWKLVKPYTFKCSLCGRTEEHTEPYCNCGAEMEWKEGEGK